jgi:hypothetical protein
VDRSQPVEGSGSILEYRLPVRSPELLKRATGCLKLAFIHAGNFIGKATAEFLHLSNPSIIGQVHLHRLTPSLLYIIISQ